MTSAAERQPPARRRRPDRHLSLYANLFERADNAEAAREALEASYRAMTSTDAAGSA